MDEPNGARDSGNSRPPRSTWLSQWTSGFRFQLDFPLFSVSPSPPSLDQQPSPGTSPRPRPRRPWRQGITHFLWVLASVVVVTLVSASLYSGGISLEAPYVPDLLLSSRPFVTNTLTSFLPFLPSYTISYLTNPIISSIDSFFTISPQTHGFLRFVMSWLRFFWYTFVNLTPTMKFLTVFTLHLLALLTFHYAFYIGWRVTYYIFQLLHHLLSMALNYLFPPPSPPAPNNVTIFIEPVTFRGPVTFLSTVNMNRRQINGEPQQDNTTSELDQDCG